VAKITDNEEYLSRMLKQQLERTGVVEEAIDLLVSQEGIPKRIAESLACGLGIFPKRYDLNAGTFGNEGQKNLLRSKVMVVGLGGLGGHVVEQLARCGVGILLGVDADLFDETNLNRQLYSEPKTIGQRKTDVTQRRVEATNNAVEFHSFFYRVEDLEDSVYQGVDLIFDCLDAIASRLYLEGVGERLDIPIVHGAIGGWYGQVAIVWPGSKLLSNVYGTKREGIEKTLGNPPFTPALVATFMVSEGIKLLLGKKEKENIVLFADLLNSQWHRVSL
jgi:molybdopterin/thiamine biosynthesis adenylyltransferase